MSHGAHGSATDLRPLRVAIVGGGLAGVATAVALADSRFVRERGTDAIRIEILESRRMLGGRATSYRDPETAELIDNCQHVSLGCCTNFDDFCRRTRIDRLFETRKVLTFLGPNGRAHALRSSYFLPAPLHLAKSLFGLSYLTLKERLSIAKTLVRLAHPRINESTVELTFGDWLRRHRQSENATRLFWSPVIVSALSEEVDRASLTICRKVFVDSFVRHRRGYEMRVPRVALRTIYDEHIVGWLEKRNVRLRLGTEVSAIDAKTAVQSLHLSAGETAHADIVCIAVPWFRVLGMLAKDVAEQLDIIDFLGRVEAVPITSVHLWLKHPVSLAHKSLVLPGRTSQWLFSHSDHRANSYLQVVISASRAAAAMPGAQLIARVCKELEEILLEPIGQNLRAAKVVTEHRAVFSPAPGIDCRRPSQKTDFPNLFFAGDWTATGWPATMEGAVRSGYLAAEAILEHLGAREAILVPDLPTATLSRLLFGVDR